MADFLAAKWGFDKEARDRLKELATRHGFELACRMYATGEQHMRPAHAEWRSGGE